MGNMNGDSYVASYRLRRRAPRGIPSALIHAFRPVGSAVDTSRDHQPDSSKRAGHLPPHWAWDVGEFVVGADDVMLTAVPEAAGDEQLVKRHEWTIPYVRIDSVELRNVVRQRSIVIRPDDGSELQIRFTAVDKAFARLRRRVETHRST